MQDSKLALITPVGGGGHPDNALPPEIAWPPTIGHPPYPSNGLPDGGDVGPPGKPIIIPAPPHIDNGLPPSAWPGVPIHPIDPGFGVGGGGGGTLPIPPIPPGTVWPPLPDIIKGTVLALVWIPGLGYRWTVLQAGKPPQAIGGGGTPEPK